MDQLTQAEIMALIGEQSILLAQANKTIRRLAEELKALRPVPAAAPDPED